jgi:uncharacterized membrane protein
MNTGRLCASFGSRASPMERLRTTWDLLRTSFWFVPSLMVLAAAALAAATVVLERRFVDAAEAPFYLYVGTPGDAQNTLAAILSSMITMASLVFSITMVVLTLAASQFGPRLIRSFMANPQTQIVLGAFVMTIIYCLLVLPTVGATIDSRPSPYVSVSMALFLTVISTGLLVLFLDTLARSIVSETVIERVAGELDGLLEDYPLLDDGDEKSVAAVPAHEKGNVVRIGAARTGYVLAIKYEQLLAAAERADVVVALPFRAGHYIVPGARQISIWPAKHVNADVAAEVQATILTGIHRTPVQDPDFPIRHLVEIAVRALSPAVNDPYTAVAVIDRLSASLCKLMERKLPSAAICDDHSRVRVTGPVPTHASLIAASFNQIRQNGARVPIVVLHLLEAIERIGAHIRTTEQRQSLCEQAAVLIAAARRQIPDASDRDAIEARCAATTQFLQCGSGPCP